MAFAQSTDKTSPVHHRQVSYVSGQALKLVLVFVWFVVDSAVVHLRLILFTPFVYLIVSYRPFTRFLLATRLPL